MISCLIDASACSFVAPAVGSGKTNTLMHMIYNLLCFDKIYLYAKNLEQSKYQNLMDEFEPISDEAGYDVIEASNDKIIPVNDLDSENQKLVIFDDFVCDRNQKPLVDYFIQGRHKNCCVIYLSQSYYNISITTIHILPFMNFQATTKNRLFAEKTMYQNNYTKKQLVTLTASYISISHGNLQQ